jgi:hypothetical protein
VVLFRKCRIKVQVGGSACFRLVLAVGAPGRSGNFVLARPPCFLVAQSWPRPAIAPVLVLAAACWLALAKVRTDPKPSADFISVSDYASAASRSRNNPPLLLDPTVLYNTTLCPNFKCSC